MSCLKKLLQHHELISPLRRGTSVGQFPFHSLIVPLTRNRHKKPVTVDVNLWAKFNVQDFDGIHILGFLSKDDVEIESGSATFEVSKVSTDNLWTETLIYNGAGILNENKILLSVPQSLIDPDDLDGELTFAIKATINRAGFAYTKKIYVNHLGVYDSIVRLRNKVDFLDLTKVDE